VQTTAPNLATQNPSKGKLALDESFLYLLCHVQRNHDGAGFQEHGLSHNFMCICNVGPLRDTVPQRHVTSAVETSQLTTEDEHTVAGQKRRLRVQGKNCRNLRDGE
jgi:hypothetical protein